MTESLAEEISRKREEQRFKDQLASEIGKYPNKNKEKRTRRKQRGKK